MSLVQLVERTVIEGYPREIHERTLEAVERDALAPLDGLLERGATPRQVALLRGLTVERLRRHLGYDAFLAFAMARISGSCTRDDLLQAMDGDPGAQEKVVAIVETTAQDFHAAAACALEDDEPAFRARIRARLDEDAKRQP